MRVVILFFFFFFQAEDGIRDLTVTGVQTCALPICCMASVLEIREKLMRIWPHLNERSRRMIAATEALGLGYGGVSLVSRVCGLSRVTITKGIDELAEPPLPEDRIRHDGGGRWKLEVRDPDLAEVLD